MIAVIDVCGNNLSSLANALTRLGYDYQLTHNALDIERASHVIIPGVGSAKMGMRALIENNLVDVIKRVEQPLLGICLGMQLLLDYSEEGDVRCLGLIPGEAKRLPIIENCPIPHMGWNKLLWSKESELKKGLTNNDYVYFVHSYAFFGDFSTNNALACCQYSEKFTAIVQQNNIYGMQFHPEKSAQTGVTLLTNFLQLEC
jgi:imidazole glycerol-phosphate synthase subunit HisH